MNKFATILTLSLSLATSVMAEDNPLWLRHPAISPDGKTIAFSYQGEIYTVPSQGGTAHQLTNNPAYDAYPVWSPDGKQLAFVSSRKGSFDVWIMDAAGRNPHQLTTHSNAEIPMAFLDNTHVLYSTHYMPTTESLLSPGRYNEVYSVSTKGGRSTLFSGIDMCDVSLRKDGTILYHDHKGIENEFRKHHVSAITRDIWMEKDGKFTQLTHFKGEDRTPRWSKDGKSFYYLSESDGTFNVYKQQLDGNAIMQLTHFTKNPVRCLTVSNKDELCYNYDGEIYFQKNANADPVKVKITIPTETNTNIVEHQLKTDGATEVAVSPNGQEVAFVVRGEVYVTNVADKTTKQITDTPQQERNISFSPDGRSLIYASDRDGIWQIYQTTIQNTSESRFATASQLKEDQLVKSDKTSQQPKYSPDGKSIAFLENRSTLKVLDLATKNIQTCMDGKYMYSVMDGDYEAWFEWSPDNKWFLCPYIGEGGWHNQDIALVSASGNGEIHDLTQSGYNEMRAHWALGGKAMLFQSDRDGDRSHGSWGSSDDAYLMFFDLDAFAQYNDGTTITLPNGDLKFDLENCRDRIVRLTSQSSHIFDMYLTPEGDKLYYLTATTGESGFWMYSGRRDLWLQDLKGHTHKMIQEGTPNSSMQVSKDGKNIFLCNTKIQQVNLSNHQVATVDFEAPFNYRPYGERKYMLEHMWQQAYDKFYDPKLHGVDWAYYKQTYERFLPHVNNNYDFKDLVSEMMGELNSSHTGGRLTPPKSTATPTAWLGAFYDESYQGDGLKIKEVVKRGPLTVRNTGITAGCIIEKIDGQTIKAGMDYFPLLEGKVGKNVQLSVFNPVNGLHFNTQVKPVTLKDQDDLLYQRWVDRNIQRVDSLSQNKLAYVHVRNMTSQYFRNVYRELLGEKNRNRQAVIVDERNNGGGWLHDDLDLMLDGKAYISFNAHGQYIGNEPYSRWTKPSCVLVNENAYSDGHIFPTSYQALGIGKVIGTPVAGTGTAVWWETQIDPDLCFGIPEVGCKLFTTGDFTENHQTEPDIEVYNTPEDILRGHDAQLERAVKELLK